MFRNKIITMIYLLSWRLIYTGQHMEKFLGQILHWKKGGLCFLTGIKYKKVVGVIRIICIK